jgi:hypothetical protein
MWEGRTSMSCTISNPPSDSPGIDPSLAEALRRAYAEFQEMPGLILTEAQAARLWACDSTRCRTVLATLVERGYLVRSRTRSHHAMFVRA